MARPSRSGAGCGPSPHPHRRVRHLRDGPGDDRRMGAHGLPYVPGHEWSGTVDAVGPGGDARLVGRPCVARTCWPTAAKLASSIRRLRRVLPDRGREAAPLARHVSAGRGGADRAAGRLRAGWNRMRVPGQVRAIVLGDGPIGLMMVALMRMRGFARWDSWGPSGPARTRQGTRRHGHAELPRGGAAGERDSRRSGRARACGGRGERVGPGDASGARSRRAGRASLSWATTPTRARAFRGTICCTASGTLSAAAPVAGVAEAVRLATRRASRSSASSRTGCRSSGSTKGCSWPARRARR